MTRREGLISSLLRVSFGPSALLAFWGATPCFSQPQYGGVMRIVDVAEGAQPIGAPWEVDGTP